MSQSLLFPHIFLNKILYEQSCSVTNKFVLKPYQLNLQNSNLSLAYPSKSHVILPNNAFFPTYHVLRKGKETIGFFRPPEQKLSLQQPNNCIKYRGSPFWAEIYFMFSFQTGHCDLRYKIFKRESFLGILNLSSMIDQIQKTF